MLQKKRGGRRSSCGLSSDINVTPLVDVMLVLLIIFMVTAPILTVGIPVDLPKMDAAQSEDSDEPIVVSINKDGQTYLKDTPLQIDQMIERMHEILKAKPNTKIFVRGDQTISYGQVMDLMSVIAGAGFNKVSLMAEIQKKKKA
ncbi:MAG: protein TolR [Candidatus Puniceispirillum sp.]|nr:protein TolR [Candidatus Pelagibacter sp.]MBA4283421.1 protein TolR [Candidatus Puniceispirillum sp.]